ncbi:hypothetical protein [Hyalangium gracile]|uniref:hypothetical protein n=1 Tax=Hyalangium gracile TaxID=394092 RepID=UPI001CCE9BA5|nr:hypothetical protein [Hyalangium gracile]
MSRQLLAFSLLFGLSTAAWAQAEDAAPLSGDPSAPTFHQGGRTPVWLPRGAFLGTYLRRGMVTPQPRLQWQVTFFEKRKDALVFVAEGGIGYAVARPGTALEGFDVPVDSFYEHTAQVGMGYRNQSPDGIHWGFQVTGGPLWYGAHMTNVDDERYSAGLVEGRFHLGYQLGSTVLGVSVGYGEPFSYRKRSVARLFAGGVLVGFFADWR